MEINLGLKTINFLINKCNNYFGCSVSASDFKFIASALNTVQYWSFAKCLSSISIGHDIILRLLKFYNMLSLSRTPSSKSSVKTYLSLIKTFEYN